MALSFESSVNQARSSQASTASVAAETIETTETVSTFSLARSSTASSRLPDGYTISEKYTWYENYYDDNLSTVDSNKNVTVSPNQINLTQEENSQFIPFQIDRYCDGIDLTGMIFQFHFKNKEGFEDYITPINVHYNKDKIRIGWLIGASATAIAGNIEFEIIATGANEKGDNYVWRTKPNKDINVLQSLVGNGIIEPSSDWYTGFVRQMNEMVAQAASSATEASTYATQAQDAIAEVEAIKQETQKIVDDSAATIEGKILESVEQTLLNYYTKSEVDEIIANLDLSTFMAEVDEKIAAIDGLAALNVTYNTNTGVMEFWNGDELIVSHTLYTNPTAEWTSSFKTAIQADIDEAVKTVSDDLSSYQTSNDERVSGIETDITSINDTLNNNIYTKEEVNNALSSKANESDLSTVRVSLSSVESTANANKTNIDTISSKIAEIEEDMDNFNTEPSRKYRATYDPETGLYSLIECEDEEDESTGEVVSQFTMSGGGGGGSTTSTTVKIDRITSSPLIVVNGDNVIIKYNFSSVDTSGDDTGEGTATWKVGSAIVATSLALQGENSFDLTPYVSVGTNKVTLSITDTAGTISVKNWTVQIVDVRLESTFDDQYTYPIGDVSFSYTPYGSIEKTVHFILDGAELEPVVTTVSGIPMSYTLPSQKHGAHLLEAYITAEVNGATIETSHIFKDIIWFDESSNVAVIGCVSQNITVMQYDSTKIVYTVYDPTTETPKVTLTVDGNVVSTQTLSSATQTWLYKSSDVGEHVLTITCRETVKTINVVIEKLNIDVTPITANLAFDFNPTGRSNNDEDRLWTDGTTSMTVSDNFDWVNGGYQLDENGDQYFCIKAGTSAVIDYMPFKDDAKKNGKEFKFVFKTTNVARPDATFLSCVDNTTDSDHIGIQMNVHEAFIYGQAGNLNLSYSEEDIIEFEFNISKNIESIPMVMGYEDGVSTCPMVYDDSYNFTQNTPKIISLGSDDCDLYIYRFKVYNTSLTDRDILSNFISDARNAEEIISRYNRNQIYDENQNLDPDVLAEKCPWLRVYKLSAPYFTNNKSDKVPYTTIQQIYKGGDLVLDNWTCYDCSHSGQGTSSNNYGAAGRNLDFIMNKSQRDGVNPYFILGDGTVTDKITLTRTSVPVAYLTAKVNIASSNNMTNAMLAERYNKFKPYNRPFVRDEGVDTSFIKDTMEFHNAVVFIQETNEDLSTHREFADTNWHKIA